MVCSTFLHSLLSFDNSEVPVDLAKHVLHRPSPDASIGCKYLPEVSIDGKCLLVFILKGIFKGRRSLPAGLFPDTINHIRYFWYTSVPLKRENKRSHPKPFQRSVVGYAIEFITMSRPGCISNSACRKSCRLTSHFANLGRIIEAIPMRLLSTKSEERLPIVETRHMLSWTALNSHSATLKERRVSMCDLSATASLLVMAASSANRRTLEVACLNIGLRCEKCEVYSSTFR